MAKRFYCCSGSPIKKIYQPAFTDSGARVLVLVGQENLNDYIQSFRDVTDINTILKRFTFGDTSVLNVNHGFCANVVGAPKTLAEMLNAQIVSNRLFDKLPADVRAAFDYDVNKFFVTYGTPTWMDCMAKFMPSQEVKE